MRKTWLLGIFILGLSILVIVQKGWLGRIASGGFGESASRAGGGQSAGPAADPSARPFADLAQLSSARRLGGPEPSESAGVPEPAETGDEQPPDPGAPAPVPGLDAPSPLAGALPLTDLPSAGFDPAEDTSFDPAAPIVFERARPGGGSEPDQGEARRQASEWIRQATLEESPLAVARLLTLALASGGLRKSEDQQVYDQLLEVNSQGILNPASDEGMFRITVEPGDNLWDICNQVEREGYPPIAPGLVCLLNGMTGDSIYPGQKLRIPTQPVSVQIRKGAHRLEFLLGEVLIGRYPVSLGKSTAPTPEGTFTIGSKEKDPAWKGLPFGHPENVLGTRWLGFKEQKSYGIHGTWEPETVGGNFSNGCVRMLNRDVEELFDWIPRGALVQISQ